MMDNYKLGNRVNNEVFGIGINWLLIPTGIALFVLGTVMVWKFGVEAHDMKKAIGKTQASCVELQDISNVSAQYDGKFVHAVGRVTSPDTLTDPLTGVRANTLRLVRKVEYFQLKEDKEVERDKFRNEDEYNRTIYTYHEMWVDKPLSSLGYYNVRYARTNFVITEISDTTIGNANVFLGAYKLAPAVIPNLKADFVMRSVTPSRAALRRINRGIAKATGKTGGSRGLDDLSFGIVHTDGRYIYIGSDPANPHIGDVRISYLMAVLPDTLSVIARVDGSTLAPYKGEGGNLFSIAEKGAKSTEQMLDANKEDADITFWGMRIFALLLVSLAMRCLFNWLERLLAAIPVARDILGLDVAFICILTGAVWVLLNIFASMLVFDPLQSIASLAIAVVCFLIAVKVGGPRLQTIIQQNNEKGTSTRSYRGRGDGVSKSMRGNAKRSRTNKPSTKKKE